MRDFLTRIAQPFHWVEAGTPAATELLAAHDASGADLPLVVDDGDPMRTATVERLVDAWRVTAAPSRTAYDLAIVGAGPAGLAAAVYAASDGLSTIVLERDVPGGQASHTSLIENFFGFPGGIGGAELARLAGRQAEGFGCELAFFHGVTGSSPRAEGQVTIEVAGGHRVQAKAVIVATGMDWRRLEVDGLEELLGRGVYYGAGRSEAARSGGQPVIVVGAGNSAGQAVMHLAEAGARVTMLVRGGDLAKSMSAYLVERIGRHPLIDVRFGTQLEAVHADAGHLSAITARAAGGHTERLPAYALFLCLGGRPHTDWATAAGIALDPAAFVLTGQDPVSYTHLTLPTTPYV